MGSLRRAFFVGERMTESRKIQLEAEMSTAGVKQGAQDIKATVSDMANAVSQEAGRAGQAVGKIGDGGEQTSQKVDRTTKSMIQSIQRVTAQMEAGSRTSAKYYETLAQQRGVDVNALRPYLDQLDDVSKKQGMASGALAAGAVQFDKYGMSAKQTAAAMRGVPAQLTDIIVSLQGGQQPMTVLLQQGGQLKDMFGGIAPAARALGGAVLGMVNPVTLAAAAVGGLYLAYRAGASESEAFNRTLIDTGNRAGLTADQLTDMSRRIGDISGTQRQAASALNDFARSSGVATQNFQDFARAAMEWESATGTAVSETVKRFEELGKAPVEASLKLNESMNYLTASVYEQIRALEASGRTSEAAELAQRTYFDTINERAPKVVQNLGLVERGWAAIKREVSEALSAVAGFGRTETLQDNLRAELEKLRGMEVLDNIGSFDLFDDVGRQRQIIADIQERIKLEAQLAGVEADRQRQQQKALQEAQAYNDYVNDPSRMSRADQMAKEIEAETLEYQKRIAAAQGNAEKIERIEAAHQLAIKDIRERFKDDKPGGGIPAPSQNDIARLNAMLTLEQQRAEQLAVVGGEVEKLNEAEKLALQYAERAKLATDAKTKARLEHNKSLAEEVGAMRRANDLTEKDLRAADQTINKLRQQTQSIEDQVATYGLGKVAIEDLAIARLEEKLAIDESLGGHDAVIAKTREELEARKQLREAMVSLETKEAEKRAWEAWSRDVEQIFQQVGQSLTDAIFEGGKSGRDLVKDLFKTLTLRVLINPVMNSIQGAVTNSLGSMFGLQNTQQQKSSSFDFNQFMGGGTGNMLSSAGNYIGSTMVAEFGAGLTAGAGGALTDASASALMNIGTNGSSSFAAGSSIGGIGLGSIAGYGSALVNLAEGKYGSAAGAAIGTYLLPGIGTAVGSLLGGFADDMFGGGPPATRHGQRTTIDYAGGNFGISAIDDRQAPGSEQAALAAAQASVTAANELFAKLGVDAAIESFYAIMESSVLGDRQGVASGGMLRTGDQMRQIGIPQSSDMTFAGFGGWSEADMLPRLATDIQLSILEAFQTQVDSLPDVLADMIRGVDVRALDAAGAQDLAARFSAVVEGASSFLQLVQTMPFDQLRDLSFDAAAGLVEVAGGLQNLTGNLNTYYENFYSEAERNAQTLRNVGKALEEVGVALPDTRQQFRALVEAQDLTTDAGRRVYAALLNVSGAFASVTQSAEQAAQESERIAEQNRQTLIGNLQSAYSAVVSAGQAEIARLQQSFGATDSAMNSYRSAVQALESEFGSLFTSIDRYISDLRGNVDASAQAQYRQARAVISTALATGQLPQTADLTEALQVAQRGVTSQVYGSLFEQNRAYAILANEMEGIKQIAEPELDAAKATLAQLEEQYALLRGTNRIAGDSLSALEQQVRLAFATEEAARHEISLVEQQLELAKQQHEKLMEALTGIDGGIKSLAEAMADFASAVAAAQNVVSGGGGGGGAGTPAAIDAATRYYAANPDVVNEFNSGTTGMGYDQYAAWHYEKYGQFEGRSYAVGTSYVPHDMSAQIHQGEIIIDPRSSDILRRYGIGVQGGDSREVVSELRALRDQNARLERRLASIEQYTGQLADQFDNVTAGGNAMATEEMA